MDGNWNKQTINSNDKLLSMLSTNEMERKSEDYKEKRRISQETCKCNEIKEECKCIDNILDYVIGIFDDILQKWIYQIKITYENKEWEITFYEECKLYLEKYTVEVEKLLYKDIERIEGTIRLLNLKKEWYIDEYDSKTYIKRHRKISKLGNIRKRFFIRNNLKKVSNKVQYKKYKRTKNDQKTIEEAKRFLER